MKFNEDLIFSLYPCCVPVNGIVKDAIYDLQREKYKLIPHSLFFILTKYKGKSVGQIKNQFKGNEKYIDQYIQFLLTNEFGIFVKKEESILEPLPELYRSPKLINNAVFDYDKSSCYDLESAIFQLDCLKCENLELRFFNKISIAFLKKVLGYAKNTTLRDIEILVQYSSEYTIASILNLRFQNARVRKITISGCPKDKEAIYESEEFYVIFTSEVIDDETHCGVVNPWYYLPKTELFFESHKYNNCLNQKISIDKFGQIKNCPSMEKSYGEFGKYGLEEIATQKSFQILWMINKDKIKICKDCELRYLCQDCRAYIVDSKDIYSKPIKCNYNPYQR